MALTVRRRGENGLSPWPGYVDALSTLLMVIIFVLLVFVLAQGFLSVALSSRDKQLDRVNRQLAEMTDMLSLEKGRNADLSKSITQLNQDLSATTAAGAALTQQFAALKEEVGRANAERDTLRTERDRFAQQLADAGLQAQSAAARNDALQAQITAMQQQMAELDRTVTADKATIETRLSDIAKLTEQIRALAALRDELQKQAENAAGSAATEQQRRAAVETQLADERKLSESARAQIALLSRQVDDLKAQLTAVAQALDLAQTQNKAKDTQIANLGDKLNTALAAKVEELQRYRSEFFGRLRDVLANRPGIQIVGDRFVFQSEVLFPLGSADMSQAGQAEINALAGTVKQIAAEIPPGINWILRVDGHTDRQPIKGPLAFASNWELSTARAITVVKLLIADGVSPEHLAATGFADNQPLDSADTPDAYAKNRRIELRLTDR
jgi:chemotaxis protein MotB